MNLREISFAPCSPADFETLLEIRIAAMRESLERAGLFDPQQSRERLERSFYPEFSKFILWKGERIGFYTFRPAIDGFHLEHFYLLPACHAQGIGSFVLGELMRAADADGLPIFLGTVKDSPANRFYQRHGFERDAEGDTNVYYIRRPSPPNDPY